MTYRISKKAWEKIRDYTDFEVISFKDGKRIQSYGGLNYVSAMHYMVDISSKGQTFIVFRKSDYPNMDTINWEESYFRQYIHEYGLKISAMDLNKEILGRY
jgi:hypothetical protein